MRYKNQILVFYPLSLEEIQSLAAYVHILINPTQTSPHSQLCYSYMDRAPCPIKRVGKEGNLSTYFNFDLKN